MRLGLNGIRVRVVNPPHYLDCSSLHLVRLPGIWRRHDQPSGLNGTPSSQPMNFITVIGKLSSRDYLHWVKARTIGHMHK